MHTKTTPKLLFATLVILVVFSLAGCVKGEVSVDVNANGSGSVGIAVGMTQEAKSMLELQGIDLGLGQGGGMKSQLEKLLINKAGSAAMGVNFDTWVDGDYEWVKAEKEVGSVEEINQIAAQSNLFQTFTLSQKNGFFQNEFVLDAVMSPLSGGLPDLGGFQMDTSSLMEMQFSLRLPGAITESNGAVDASDPNKLVWVLQGDQPISIKASSTSWNWQTIAMAGAAIIIIVLVIVVLLVFAIFKLARKSPSSVA